MLSRGPSPGPQQQPAPADPEVFFDRIKARLNVRALVMGSVIGQGEASFKGVTDGSMMF